MNYRTAFLPTADRDIDAIEEYLSQFYTSTVRNFFLRLEKQVATLEKMPYICPTYEEDPFSGEW